MRYDPYGAVTRLDSAGSNGGWNDNPYLFHGGVQDRATGNIKIGQRFYNPTTGNWTQQDTLNAPLDPHNANRYVYAADDPINISDPTGSFSFVDALGDVSFALGVAAVTVTTFGIGDAVLAGAFTAGALYTGAAGVACSLPTVALSTIPAMARTYDD